MSRTRITTGRVVLILSMLVLLVPTVPAGAQLEGPLVRVDDVNGHEGVVSDDGTAVGFRSSNNLAQSTQDGGLFVYDVPAATYEQVDVKPNSGAGDGSPLGRVLDLSADGRFILFTSARDGLTAGQPVGNPGAQNLYLRDRTSGATTLLSVDAEGAPYVTDPVDGEISDDGSVALLRIQDPRPELGPDEADCPQSFGDRHYTIDTASRVHTLLTADADGCPLTTQGFSSSDMSADGRFVVISTPTTEVIPGRMLPDGNNIVLLDRQTSAWEWLTEGADGDSFSARINGNGSRVVFTSEASNLVADDTNFRNDVFLMDRDAGATTLVSRDAATGQPGLEDSGNTVDRGADISADGRFIAFQSEALLAGPGTEDDGNSYHVFRYDATTGALARADVRDDGESPNSNALASNSIGQAGDGSVVFSTASSDLITGQTGAGLFLARGNATPMPPPPPPPADPQAIIDQAVEISLQRFAPNGTSGGPAEYAILATGENFADALSGAVLTQKGPMLFTRTSSLPQITAEEIGRALNGTGTVYVLGGTAAVSDAVTSAVTAAGHTVVRLSGNSRFETSVAIAQQARTLLGDTGEVALARAFGPEGNPTAAWADSVTGGAWAADEGTPIVLTTSDAVHPAVQAFLDSDAPSVVRLLGGTAALSDAVMTATSGVRTAGATRSDTARQIALQLWEVPEEGTRGYLILDATAELGWGYGLAGAGLAADRNTPVLSTSGSTNPPETLAAVAGCDNQVRLAALGPLGAGLLDELDAADTQAC